MISRREGLPAQKEAGQRLLSHRRSGGWRCLSVRSPVEREPPPVRKYADGESCRVRETAEGEGGEKRGMALPGSRESGNEKNLTFLQKKLALKLLYVGE